MRLANLVFKLIFMLPLITGAQTIKLIQTDEPPLDSMSIVGNYIRAFPPEFETSTLLTLNADRTFEIKDHPDLRGFISKGRWYIRKGERCDLLFLTSDSLIYGISNVTEREAKNDSLKFFVEDINGMPFSYGDIQLESPWLQLDSLGKGNFKPQGIRSFVIREVVINNDYPTYRYEIKNPKANVFTVKIKKKEEYYLYMDDLYWKIGVNVLYCPENGMLLKKVE
jgi:hypothetical protein